MTGLLHQIEIDRPASKVYDRLTSAAGLRGWWTGDSVAKPEVGSIAEFGFGERSTRFRMRVDELVPDRRVVWSCIGDVEEWRGTRLVWEIVGDANQCALKFRHADWRSTTDWFAPCNTTWGHLMHYLKGYAEGARPGPFFTGKA